MSNIPAARKLLKAALESHRTKSQMCALIGFALRRMKRVPAKTHARGAPIRVTKAVRNKVKALAKKGLSQATIAHMLGLRNAGRVSEILHGKR
jgi:hypothetical protein